MCFLASSALSPVSRSLVWSLLEAGLEVRGVRLELGDPRVAVHQRLRRGGHLIGGALRPWIGVGVELDGW